MGANEINADTICELLIQYDELPPNDDYSGMQFGEDVANKIIDDSQATKLISHLLAKLPSCLAGSFLEGFLSIRCSRMICSSMFEDIKNVRSLTGAAIVAHLIVEFGQIDDKVVFEQILSHLQQSLNSFHNERYCFAIWSFICGESFDLATGKVVKKKAVTTATVIGELLKRDDLNDYCVVILKQCYDKLTSVSQSS